MKFTVRDEKVARVLAQDNAAVDDGWLCDKGRFSQMFHSEDRITAPMLRQGGVLSQVSWDEALGTVASGLRATGAKPRSWSEARPRTRRATSCSGSPARRSGSHVDSRAGAPLDRKTWERSPRPSSAPRCRTSTARTRSCSSASTRYAMPILDLRLRRRCGARTPAW